MPSFNTNAQDMFASDYRVYIEGVQVPFESAHISNTYGQLPSASVSLPPWPGLQELGRNYMPKIDIFWRDYNLGVTAGEAAELGDDTRDAQRDAYKLIFSGVIHGTTDSKNVSPDSGSQSIALNCIHALSAMSDILIRYGNQAIQAAQAQLASNGDSSVTIAEWDINTMMIKALMGVEGGLQSDDAHFVERSKVEELQGTPGILRVMWNILKRDANTLRGLGKSSVLTEIYIPLIEDGLQFWERMTGHAEIESGIQDDESRIDYNDGTENSTIRGVNPDLKGKVMIPSVFRSFLGAAAQKELALTAMQSLQAGAGSPESSNFMDHVDSLLTRLEYDMVTLSSPVSVGVDGKRRYEYIIKPILSSYYSPICNVVLPNMLDSITVSNNYEAVPSRTVNLTNLGAMISSGNSGTTPDQAYMSPHSVRYARAEGDKGDLSKSLVSYNNVPGKYEYGSGVKARTTQLPSLYNLMYISLDKAEAEDGINTSVNGTDIYSKSLSAWDKMYPEERWPGALKYNPLKLDSGISSFSRLNFMYSDQQFAMETSKARTAQASGVFNPYAIVGYPMDLVDAVPSRESYHGLCTSVTHVIHASGQSSTSYGMSAATSFSELASYNIPAVNPYLSGVFEFEDDSRIYANKKAYEKACKIYLGVLGVGAAEPALLQDYSTGVPIPFSRTEDSGCWSNTADSQFLDTVQGSLMLVARNISSLLELENDRIFRGKSEFIDIADWSDSDPSDVSEVSSATSVEISEDGTKISTLGRDTESSPFLDY